MRLHDIGLELVERDGELGARVFVGGGMGRTPMIAPEINPFVKADDLLSYLEACLRVYNRYGRRDNIYKARIKILIHELGAAEYARQVAEEFVHVKALGIDPPAAELARISGYFASPKFEIFSSAPAQAGAQIKNEETGFLLSQEYREEDGSAFATWVKNNTHPHKQPGYIIANISLKPIGGIPGDASSAQIDVMADLAERYSFDELRVTHAQNIVLPHVAKRDLRTVYDVLVAHGLASANLDLITDIIACPGLDYCSLANARSIPVAQKIAQRFADPARQALIGELKLKISGCINACGHHHAGHIGILGVDRKGIENYQLLLGGSGAEDASLAKITGPGFDEDGIVDAIERTVETYLAMKQPQERFLDTYRRVGFEPFKEAIYG
jgi:sulfite reductase (NADPH) hemoprotein beta-component